MLKILSPNICSGYIIIILGTEVIERPVYRNENHDDEEFVTLSWEHNLEAAVSHYILTLVAAEDSSRVSFQYNITSTSITIPSTRSNLNGSLSAVSVCGDKSDHVSFQGNNNIIILAPGHLYSRLLQHCLFTRYYN